MNASTQQIEIHCENIGVMVNGSYFVKY